ncbi:hypothetical protein QJS10_CPA08g01459 [Acorus calamus]|uniref:Uncharacterized protein n=1 Tax=Acorus calamus TaxID=4465 RepID=A0AAV9EBF2_ACOCL|nr:hypothetical protein QJS10_CPA08g01459 [Acorus calamus]
MGIPEICSFIQGTLEGLTADLWLSFTPLCFFGRSGGRRQRHEGCLRLGDQCTANHPLFCDRLPFVGRHP